MRYVIREKLRIIYIGNMRDDAKYNCESKETTTWLFMYMIDNEILL